MSLKRFLTGLGMTSLVQLIVCLLLLWWYLPMRAHLGFVISSIVAMMLFCVMMYAAARIFAQSPLTRLYIQLIMIAVFLKMLVCLALVIGYKKGFDPVDHTFVWPFLFIYLTSTIYEVIFLEKVGRQKQSPLP